MLPCSGWPQNSPDKIPGQFKDISRIIPWFSRMSKFNRNTTILWSGITMCLIKSKPLENVIICHRRIAEKSLVPCVAAPIWEKGCSKSYCTLNSRISRIILKIQGPFKDFKDLSEIQGFQGFFQGCGHPVASMNLTGAPKKNVYSSMPFGWGNPIETQILNRKFTVLRRGSSIIWGRATQKVLGAKANLGIKLRD